MDGVKWWRESISKHPRCSFFLLLFLSCFCCQANSAGGGKHWYVFGLVLPFFRSCWYTLALVSPVSFVHVSCLLGVFCFQCPVMSCIPGLSLQDEVGVRSLPNQRSHSGQRLTCGDPKLLGREVHSPSADEARWAFLETYSAGFN